MQMNAYLSFRGECEAAFKFYEERLDGKLGEIFRYAGMPWRIRSRLTGRTRSCTALWRSAGTN